MRAGALSAAERSYPHPRSVAAGRRHPTSEVRGGSREETPRVRGQGCGWEEPPTPEALAPPPGGATRGAVAAQEQEGLEELSHVEGQELWQ